MRRQHAEFVTADEDRELKEGDHATVDYTSFHNGEEIENGSVTNYMMEMKPENYIDGFVENLVGAKAGEEREFEITFPEEYNNEELAGETVTFKFKVHDIKEKRLPELDDEFAQSHSEYDSLDELKKAVRERLEEGVKKQADGQVVTTIVKDLLEQVPEDIIPPQLRQHHAQKAIRARMYELAQRGMNLEQVLAARGITQDVWLQEMMGAGLFEARLEVLYKSIARDEGIEVDPDEMEEIIKSEAKSHKMKPKKLRKQMEKNGSMEMLEYNLLMEKLHKVLLEKADVKYVPPGTKSEEDEDSGEKAEKSDEPKKSKKSKAKAKKSEEKKADKKDKDEKSESKAKTKTKSKSKKSSKTKSSSKSKSKSKSKSSSKSKSKASKKKSKKSSKKKAK